MSCVVLVFGAQKNSDLVGTFLCALDARRCFKKIGNNEINKAIREVRYISKTERIIGIWPSFFLLFHAALKNTVFPSDMKEYCTSNIANNFILSTHAENFQTN